MRGFKLIGVPQPRKRARASIAKSKSGKYFIRMYDEQNQEMQELKVRIAMIWNSKPIDGPVGVRCNFYLPRPKNHYGTGRNAGKLKPSAPIHHTKIPDVDNLEKMVFDAMNGIVWKDDSQVVDNRSSKEYGEQPRTEVRVYEL